VSSFFLTQVDDGEVNEDENGEFETESMEQSIDIDEVEEVEDDEYDDDDGVI